MKKKLLLIALLIGCASFTALAQNVLTPETLWKLGRLGDHKVSPDGKTVVFSVRNFDVAANKGFNTLFTIPVTGGTPASIADSSDKPSSPRWSPDGRSIFYLSTKSGSSQIWQMNPDGTGKKQVSSTPGSITNFSVSPGGDKIWYTREVQIGKTVTELYPDLPKATGRIYDDLMYRHWDSWQDRNFSHVFYATFANGALTGETDLMPGEPYDSPLAPFGGESQISWSPDGQSIAYTCKKLSGTEYAMSTNSDIYLYNLTTKSTVNITEGMPGYDTYPAFSPDGSKLTWLSMETPMYEADRNRLMQIDLKSKTKTELTKGFDYSIESYSWSKDGRLIYFISGINATDQLWVYDSFKKGTQQISQLTTDVADVTGFSHATAGKKTIMVTAAMSISSPTDLFTVDVTSGKSTRLTSINQPVMNSLKLGKVEKRMVKATDGKEILTWVIYPPDFDPAKKYPALLYCQGGPQSTVSQFFSYRWNFQLMAANGYIVVAPNRRGLPSFGTEWNREISGDWGGQAMRDLLSAIDDVSKEPFVNKEKLGAVGASFGGYSVYWLAGNHNKRFKSFISHCGVFNLQSMYGTTEELFFADFDMGGSYFKKPQHRTYTEFNPINFVNNWDTPMLVIHNDLDFRVPISQGMEAFTAARLKGIPARFLSFPDENHWVLKPQNNIMWHRVFFEWLEKDLKADE